MSWWNHETLWVNRVNVTPGIGGVTTLYRLTESRDYIHVSWPDKALELRFELPSTTLGYSRELHRCLPGWSKIIYRLTNYIHTK
jgi:hypothetical protein